MFKPRRSTFFIHELIFGAFLVLTWLRLVFSQGILGSEALIFALGPVIAIALAMYDHRTLTDASLRWRFLYYPIAMNLYFQQLRTAIPAITPVKYDTWLRSLDSALLGDTPSILWQAHISPGLTELMSLFYLFFFPYLLMGIVMHFLGPLWRLKSFMSGLFSLYGLGFIGYTLIPAAGPYLAFPESFSVALAGGALTVWNTELVRVGSIGVDVFPSLHVAVSLFILGFDFKHNRLRFWICLIPCIGLWSSTLYLRYHYLIDVIFGILLASFALWISYRNTKKDSL